jgi:hypothetical protein
MSTDLIKCLEAVREMQPRSIEEAHDVVDRGYVNSLIKKWVELHGPDPLALHGPILGFENFDFQNLYYESPFRLSELLKPLKTDAVDAMLFSTCECGSCLKFNVKQRIKQQIVIIKRRTDRLRGCSARIKNPRRMRRLLRQLAKAGTISGPCMRWTEQS